MSVSRGAPKPRPECEPRPKGMTISQKIYQIFLSKAEKGQDVTFTYSEAIKKYGFTKNQFSYGLYKLKTGCFIKIIRKCNFDGISPTIYRVVR